MERSSRNGRLFWPVAAGFLLTDFVTKWWAVKALAPEHSRHEVVGDWMTFTLLHNRGAAFGLDLGNWSRWIFTALTIGAVVILTRMYQATAEGNKARLISLGMILGGACGNLIDRLRSSQGVVDFIDIGIGDARWPTFNVADIGVSCGALLLAWVLWREDRAAAAHATTAASDTSSAH